MSLYCIYAFLRKEKNNGKQTKKWLHYVSIPQKDFFSQRQDQNLRKRKRERGKNVRICSPSLALKKKEYRKVLHLVLSGANMCPSSLWTPPLPLTPDPLLPCAELWPRRAVSHLQVLGGRRRVARPASWRPVITLTSQSRWDKIKDLTPLHFLILLLSHALSNTKMWNGFSEMQLILWLPKALRAKCCWSPNSWNCNQTVTKPMPQP